MPVGDFPTVFPTIVTCRLNRMVTSKNCIIHKRYCICSNTLLVFIDHICFADHEHVFWVNTCIFRICIYLQYDVAFFLHIMTLFIVHGKICLQFTCICCKFAVPYTVHGRHGTVENASRIL